ncbi:unnamed protein product [Rhizoctonia solani]|uniref:Uncharacterized protein n=1 Tax=Rhizoctonia solani TaxID=456999 RepID=A0A8H2ZWI8_9AGAM|nr:unnamed protein product [Rhizoctonia solani]
MKLTTAYTFTFLTIVFSNVLNFLVLKVLPDLQLAPLLACLAVSLALPLACYLYINFSIQHRLRLERDDHHDMACGSQASADSPDVSRTILAITFTSSFISTIQRYYVVGTYVHTVLVSHGAIWERYIYALGGFELLAVLCIGVEIWESRAAASKSTSWIKDELIEKCEMGQVK